MKKIKLAHGKHAIVDDEDFDKLNQFKWSLAKTGKYNIYAQRGVAVSNQNHFARTYLMHREILKLKRKDGKIVDHINGNGLDNRKKNLRICSALQNAQNRKKHDNNKSGHVGVHKNKQGTWTAQIKYKHKQVYLGTYKNIEEASGVFINASKKYKGDFCPQKE